MNNSDVKKILDNLPKGAQRNAIADILKREVKAVVKCMSKTCKGRIIAHVYTDENVKPIICDDGVMHLWAHRSRLDGHMGFQCDCGNDSRLCEAEKGVKGIENNAVDKSDLEIVWNRLQSKPTSFKETKTKKSVDNFTIEQI